MRSKYIVCEVFWYGVATFQGSSKHFQVFRFNETMKRFWYLDNLDRMHPL